MLEVLWAEPVIETWIGRRLREHRDAFLSTRVFHSYGGYARQQINKAAKGIGGSRGHGHFKREKFLLHTLRLMRQGIDLLRTGELTVRVADPEALWEQARSPLTEVDAIFEGMEHELREARESTSLPPEPDVERIDQLLIGVRQNQPHTGD